MTSAIAWIIFSFLLKTQCSDFIVKDDWPLNSPDLSPLDCYVWGSMLRTFY